VRKIYYRGGLTHEALVAVAVNLPNQEPEEAEDGQHGEDGGDAAQHAHGRGNKLAAP
jgi:hypothetical protein